MKIVYSELEGPIALSSRYPIVHYEHEKEELDIKTHDVQKMIFSEKVRNLFLLYKHQYFWEVFQIFQKSCVLISKALQLNTQKTFAY